MRISLLTLLLALAGFARGASSLSEGAGGEERPNLVLILADDQGWTGLSVAMDPAREDSRSDYYRTPHLARLAREGMRFTQAYAPAPVCSPTRHSIQFGMSPARIGVTNDNAEHRRLCEPEQALASLIRRADPDYATAHFGKWHVSLTPKVCGFEVSDGSTDNRQGSDSQDEADPKRVFEITERSIGFMEEQVRSARPFFLQISHYADHVEVRGRPESVATFEARARGERHADPVFAAMNADLDEGVGRVLAAIDRLGIRERTWVVYMADNGFDEGLRPPARGKAWPLSYGKGFLFEGGIRVPFLVRGPGVAAGSTSDVIASGVDLLPTFLELVGAGDGAPATIEGGSLLGVLLGGGAGTVRRPEDFLVFHYPRGAWPAQSAIRRGDHKLIKTWAYGRVELFDLAADPGETRDLCASQPERAAELSALLAAYLEREEARLPARVKRKADRDADVLPDRGAR